MENARRTTTIARKFVSGLAKCIEKNITSNPSECQRWKQAKDKQEKLCKPEQGGSYEVFNQHPRSEDIAAYCVGNVQHLPELRKKFWIGRSVTWQDLVRKETLKRMASSQMSGYQPHGKQRILLLGAEPRTGL